MNKLEIKYFNNIGLRIKSDPRLISNGGFQFEHELIDPTLNNFYEFYIDGTPLIQIVLGPKKSVGFLKNYNGLLGARDKIYDELLVNSLLKHKVDNKFVRDHYDKYDQSIKEEHIPGLIYELGLSNPVILVYGCKICGDRDCGGLGVEVKKEANHYSWGTYNKETSNYDKYLFKFDELEYKKVFNDYLDNWSRAKTGEMKHHQW